MTSYTYDANGNTLTATVDDAVSTKTYTHRDEMSTFTNDTTAASYTYGVDGLRTSKTVNGTTTDFITDGGNVIAEITDGTVTQYFRGVDLCWEKIGSGKASVYHYNLHGDTSKLTNTSLTTVADYDYDAFGNLTSKTASVENPFLYCGEYMDSETGLIYLRARYYDPSIGAFISEDPAHDGLNWYAYCAGDPVNFVDPGGLKKTAKNGRGQRYDGSDNKDCINGQGINNAVKDLYYGCAKIADNGCELVAVYNALVLVQKKPNSFEDVINKAENINGVIWLGGIFGSHPDKLGKVFDKYGVNYSSTTNSSDFNSYLHKGGVYVVSVWNDGMNGIHTVVFTCDENNNIIVYNRYSNVAYAYIYYSTDSKTGLDLFLEENSRSIILYEIIEEEESDSDEE